MPAPVLQQARILVVDDEPANVLLLERVLQRGGYTNVASTTDARCVLQLFQEARPDLVLLDLRMPYIDGFAVMEQLQPRIATDEYLPILVLTADITAAARERALSGGAKDFLTKPLDATEVLLRIHNLLETRFLHLQLQGQMHVLEEKVAERTQDLDLARLEILERLSRAAQYRDYDTGRHAQRVGELARLLAGELGWSAERLALIRQAAPLHDIGKIGISDALLLKPGRLTPEEFEAMKAHTVIGAGMLSGSRSPLLQLAEEIALYHHERWDGAGYAHMEGEHTSPAARIVAVADVFDALTHRRPYREAWPLEDAAKHIRKEAGLSFDPDVVSAFTRVLAHLSEESCTSDPAEPPRAVPEPLAVVGGPHGGGTI